MARLSNRILGITGGGGDGWEVDSRTRALVAAGEPVVQLTVGDHDVRTDTQILDRMHTAGLAGHTGYAAISGISALRQAVADRISARSGVTTGPENVLITPGGQSALFTAHMSVCDPGDRALYCEPYYATYPGVIRAVGAVPVAIPCLPENKFYPQAAHLSAHATGARSLLINSPNNPTGAVYDRATMDGICGVCEANDLWLISDEVYETQVWQGAHITPRAAPGMIDRVLVAGSMSKGHAMTGSRIGWLVGPAEVIEKAADLSTVTTFGVPGFIQEAALFALSRGDAFEAEIAAPFQRRRDLAHRILAGQNVVGLHPADGAMYLMLDIRKTGMSGIEFANALLDEERIGVMPGESFGAAAAGHLRVAMTVADEAFGDALERLVAFAGERVAP